jgi:hypothetical protein
MPGVSRTKINPIMSSPPFDQAVSRFQIFLESEGWSPEIVWTRAEDLVWQSGVFMVRTIDVSEARGRYETGRLAGLGVMLDAHCTVAGLTCASIEYPEDEDEAERLMYPSDGGLKLSARVRRIEGRWAEVMDKTQL